jgi:hypothetical protein
LRAPPAPPLSTSGLFVALDALPPGPNLFPGNGEQFRLAPNGMVDQSSSLLPWFLEMVAKQHEINGHTIIAADLFKSDFTGNPPLDIQGENAWFRDGRIASDSVPRRPIPERPTTIPIR